MKISEFIKKIVEPVKVEEEVEETYKSDTTPEEDERLHREALVRAKAWLREQITKEWPVTLESLEELEALAHILTPKEIVDPEFHSEGNELVQLKSRLEVAYVKKLRDETGELAVVNFKTYQRQFRPKLRQETMQSFIARYEGFTPEFAEKWFAQPGMNDDLESSVKMALQKRESENDF